MKRVFAMMLFLVIALGSYAGNKKKGELRTEINGFQWYCYQGKEAYTLDGQKIFGHLKSIRSIAFSAADKNDKGIFVIKYKSPYHKRTGAFDPYTYNEICGVNNGDEPCDMYSVVLTFSNPNHTEYYVRADENSKLSGPTFNCSKLCYTKGDKSVLGHNFNSFSIKGNYIIFTWTNFSYVTRFDGKEITSYHGQIFFQQDANHFICKGDNQNSHYLDNNITIYDTLGNTIIKGIKDANYNNGFIEIENNEGKGIMSYSGKWIVSPEKGYNDYHSFTIGSKTFCKVKYQNSLRYHLLTTNGEDVFGKDFDEIDILGGNYFKVKNGGSYGVFAQNGKEIISTNRGYTSISNYNFSNETFAFSKKGYTGVCNKQGEEISLTKLAPTIEEIKTNGDYADITSVNNDGKKYYIVKSKGWRYGLIDAEGNVIVPTEMNSLEEAGIGFLKFKVGSYWGIMNYDAKVIIPTDRGYTWVGNYVSITKRFPYEMDGYKGECNNLGQQVSKIKVAKSKPSTPVASSSRSSSSSSSNSSASTTSSSSSTSSNNNNTSNNTTTVVVEHKHDPVPVQQWQACFACGGMGTMGCDNCGGSGTKYIGDRLHRCSRCNGRGIIPCNTCFGNKGQYVTVYK